MLLRLTMKDMCEDKVFATLWLAGRRVKLNTLLKPLVDAFAIKCGQAPGVTAERLLIGDQCFFIAPGFVKHLCLLKQLVDRHLVAVDDARLRNVDRGPGRSDCQFWRPGNRGKCWYRWVRSVNSSLCRGDAASRHLMFLKLLRYNEAALMTIGDFR